MGQDLQSGHTYSDTESGREVTADNLNNHVNGAVIKETFLSSKPSKGTPQLSDQLLITDGVLRKTSLQAILALFQPEGFLADTTEGRAKMADGFLSADEAGRAKMDDGFVTAAKLTPGIVHDQTALATLADADEFLVWDQSATALTKITRSDLVLQLASAGAVLNTVAHIFNDVHQTADHIPYDNSVPTDLEGYEILRASITPKSSTSKILVNVTVHIGCASTNVSATCALFRVGTSSALAAANLAAPSPADGPETLSFQYLDSPAAASEQTYFVKVGSHTGSLNINGIGTEQRFGGALKCLLLLQEIKG